MIVVAVAIMLILQLKPAHADFLKIARAMEELLEKSLCLRVLCVSNGWLITAATVPEITPPAT